MTEDGGWRPMSVWQYAYLAGWLITLVLVCRTFNPPTAMGQLLAAFFLLFWPVFLLSAVLSLFYQARDER